METNKNIMTTDSGNKGQEQDIMQMKFRIYQELQDYVKQTLMDLTLAEISKRMGAIFNFPLTVRQVAQLTGRSEQNIYKMMQRERIPYTKVGNQVHINLRDINNILIQV